MAGMSKASWTILAAAIALAACTTTNYGTKPQPVAGAAPDTFKFKMFVGGLSGGDTADEAVVPDIEAFKKANGYAGYTVTARQFNAMPSSYEYIVRFSR